MSWGLLQPILQVTEWGSGRRIRLAAVHRSFLPTPAALTGDAVPQQVRAPCASKSPQTPPHQLCRGHALLGRSVWAERVTRLGRMLPSLCQGRPFQIPLSLSKRQPGRPTRSMGEGGTPPARLTNAAEDLSDAERPSRAGHAAPQPRAKGHPAGMRMASSLVVTQSLTARDGLRRWGSLDL